MRVSVLPVIAIAVAAACYSETVPSDVTAPTASKPAFAVIAPTPTEADAVAISQNIQANHWPYHTLLNPRYASGDPNSPDYMTLSSRGYTQAADNAIWTGHYLAAEAFRYKVTSSADALANVAKAVKGITALIDVTGTDLLARFLIPLSSPYAEYVLGEEAPRHGRHDVTYNGEPYGWLGNTSRDQYSGVFFGLGIAYSLLPDGEVRDEIRSDVTRMLNFLVKNAWNVRMPDGTISTTFTGRPEQKLSFLQVGRLVDAAKWDASYKTARTANASSVGLAITYECFDPYGSYYKFNLDHINFYNLIRLEEAGTARNYYLSAFQKLRNCTGTHQNAHFNMIARGLQGVNSTRDAETVNMLGLWLLRPRRNVYVDNTGKYPACGTRACSPIPVNDRYTTDFIWQRSPFQLAGGEDGAVPTPGVDYILPYWMARYYQVVTQ
ncbi:MAG: hypothetical protein ACJ79F_08320 [Gemmatimonadaceae bacterium]